MPSLERILEIRDEALADDIPVAAAMEQWTERDVAAFFEAGGMAVNLPREHAARSPSAPGRSVDHEMRSCLLVSDMHVEHKGNGAWLDALPDGRGGAPARGSVLLCAGDVATNPTLLRRALRALKRAYETVFFVPGNHDLWVTCKTQPDSMRKYDALLALCAEENVMTGPARFSTPDGRGLWIVPLASWHHASWDTDPPLRAPPGMQLTVDPKQRHSASDDACCKWPSHLQPGSDALAAAVDARNDTPEYREAIASIARERAEAAAAGHLPPLVVSLSHMLPKQALLPEKRHLFMPTLHEIVGSSFLNERVEALAPHVHCFGHTHFAWDQTLPSADRAHEVRYVSWPLGSPHEQARRVPYARDKAACKAWLPVVIWESASGWASEIDNCYFSDLYKQRGRHPERYEMAAYTASIYCPTAPIDEMISAQRGEQTDEDLRASESSLHGQVRRHAAR